MNLIYILIWGTWVIFGISVVWALSWAVDRGHLSDVEQAGRSIFDEEEPVGEMTDFFPGEGPDGYLEKRANDDE